MVPKRHIVIPNEIASFQRKLTLVEEEVQGVLFYSAMGRNSSRDMICPVHELYLIGSGSPGRVTANETKLEVVREFLRETNGKYAPIFWHTHTQETIRRFGAQYGTTFSNQDMAVILRNLETDPLYLAMLTTPKTTLIAGAGHPEIDFLEFNGLEENKREISEKLSRIEKELDADNIKVIGTIK